jgi:hypothetical protein
LTPVADAIDIQQHFDRALVLRAQVHWPVQGVLGAAGNATRASECGIDDHPRKCLLNPGNYSPTNIL